MTTALLSAGTSTVVASVTRVSNELALPVMTNHRRAARHGHSPAAALADAMPADHVAGFVCFGAG
jgi:hypothetical protein